jgi:hypothetical protein
MRGLFPIAPLLFLAASASHAAESTAVSDRRLVIVESPENRVSKDAKEHLRSAIGDVVSAHGLRRASSQPLSDKLLRCELPACLPQIAAATGATLVLRVEATFAKESFKLAIELWNSDEGRLLGREERDCPICDEQDMWGSAALLVQGLLDRSSRESKPAPSDPATATAPAAFAPHPARSALVETGQKTEESGSWAGYAGASVALVGAGLLGAGMYYMAVDGKSDCERCDWRRDTRKDGQRLAIGGGAALAVGAGLLLWRFWPAGPAAPAVSFGPSGLVLAGRFQ